jgi:hypothetical protein
MRKLFLGISLFSWMAGATAAADWTGWISDESCGKSNASAEGRACAKTCIEGGSAAVLVTDKDQKVYKLSIDKDKALANLATRVKVTGTLKGDTIQVAKIESLK